MKSLDCVVNQPLPASWNSVTVLENFSWDPDLKKTNKKLDYNCLLKEHTDYRVVLKRHFGQGQLFYKTAHCRKMKRIMGNCLNVFHYIVASHKNQWTALSKSLNCFGLTCWPHKLSSKTPTKKYNFDMTKQHLDWIWFFLPYCLWKTSQVAYLYCFLSCSWK